jgi:hypothetical protein
VSGPFFLDAASAATKLLEDVAKISIAGVITGETAIFARDIGAKTRGYGPRGA